MVNDEPYDDSQNSSANLITKKQVREKNNTYQGYKEIPGDVPDGESQPLGPDLEQADKEHTENCQAEVQLLFEGGAGRLRKDESKEAFTGSDLLVIRAHDDILGSLSVFRAEIAVVIWIRVTSFHVSAPRKLQHKLHEVECVINFVQIMQIIFEKFHDLRDLQLNFILKLNDREDHIGACTKVSYKKEFVLTPHNSDSHGLLFFLLCKLI